MVDRAHDYQLRGHWRGRLKVLGSTLVLPRAGTGGRSDCTGPVIGRLRRGAELGWGGHYRCAGGPLHGQGGHYQLWSMRLDTGYLQGKVWRRKDNIYTERCDI